MSRIGRKPIPIPDGVNVTIEPEVVRVAGGPAARVGHPSEAHPAHRHIRHVSTQGYHCVCLGSPAFLDEIDERRGQCPVLRWGLAKHGAQLVAE